MRGDDPEGTRVHVSVCRDLSTLGKAGNGAFAAGGMMLTNLLLRVENGNYFILGNIVDRTMDMCMLI